MSKCCRLEKFIGRRNLKYLKSALLLICMSFVLIVIQQFLITDDIKKLTTFPKENIKRNIESLANPIVSQRSKEELLHMELKVGSERGLLQVDKKVESEEGKLPMDKKVAKRLRRYGYSSPLVVPAYNFILFWNEKAACTFWKALCRQIQNISSKVDDNENAIHNPRHNGLTTLRHYNDSEIINMMNNKSWTKAAFVREPRARFLSAYLDKMKRNRSSAGGVGCWKPFLSFENFVKVWAKKCHDVHWETQVRMPVYLYKTMLLGKMENLSQFAEMVLKKIGAFSTETQKWLQEYGKRHPTNAVNKIRQYYTPELEREVIKMYEQDFDVFNYSKNTLL